MKAKVEKQTDMTAVKTMAHLFLRLDISETPVSPLVVKHPFIESAVHTIKTDNGMEIKNLLEYEDALAEVREQYAQRIDDANTPLEIYVILSKPYRLTFLKYVEEYLSDKDFAKYLADGWVSSENPNGDVNVSLRTFVKWFRKADKKLLMNDKDYKVYRDLPSTFRVYRGVAVGRNPKGLSWTRNLSTAEWFAKRFDTKDKKGYIQTAVISRSDALAYFNTRGEDEIVADSFKMDITIM